jgi:hypothetical protein
VGGHVTDRVGTLLVDASKEAGSDVGSGRPDSIGQEADPEGEDRPLAGRHRAEPSPVRRAGRAAAWGFACLLAAAVLGWAAAVMVGLTGPADLASGAVGVPPAPGVQVGDPADRTFERTVEVTGKPPRSDEIPAPASATTVDQPAPASDPATSTARPPSPGPSVAPTPTPVPTVSAGDRCSTEGAAGVTGDGRAAVCTAGPGNGKTRWRHA